MMKPYLAILPVTLLITACGSSGGGNDGGPDDLAKIDRFNDLEEQVNMLPDPIAEQLPVGTVVYNGFSSVDVSVSNDVIGLHSDAEITVDFASNTIAGSLTNFERSDNTVVPYEGSITLANGTTSLDDFQFGADYSGTLTGEGNTIVLSGELSGGPRGESGEALQLEDFPRSGQSATLNGTNAGVFIDVYATQ